ncbi:acetoacetate decarboxylase family protein [Rhodococcus sp. D2-41]|uniref:Acetoacetate decarboxylase family protein n=1 Tax=Speluncibacter jeojiensis TaxID=2710754 RepID=A0A9X4RD91_9ACTN|nr:acetoacetate decarboxylase family protein [Rhodococcus sp. D2-41]MDG3009865.1 acetoacetate decarboxylase family protein [Rhodococcus sp. D2-41]MDG3014615.1 acetoacetate decarboxylase family protein [Corynebacteriales bacterium D3-21]
MPGEGYLIQGERVAMPVRIRDANAHAAMYSVPAAAAQRIIDHSGLHVLEYRPGRTVCTVLFVQYVDGDLHRYHEYGVGFLVRPVDGGPIGDGPGDLRTLITGRAGVFIHRLPVNEEFTLEAGRTIWGFPKVMSQIDIERDDAGARGVLRLDGQLVADLRVRPGLPVPGGGLATSLDAYAHLDGHTRRIPWKLEASGTRMRPGGAELILGEHPWADELRELGLPKRAMFASGIAHVRMTFEEAQEVG